MGSKFITIDYLCLIDSTNANVANRFSQEARSGGVADDLTGVLCDARREALLNSFSEIPYG